MKDEKTYRSDAKARTDFTSSEFPETRWTLVIKASQGSDETRFRALTELCEMYWFPLYAYARRSGRPVQDAEDLTQSFFQSLLRRDSIRKWTDVRGKLRSYLLSGLKKHMAGDWRREHSQKRGGFATHLSIDAETGEQRYQNEPRHSDSPDKVFQRQWALTLLKRALNRLRQEYSECGKGAVFDGLEPYLDEKFKRINAAEIGSALKMSEGAVRVALYRMRHRLRECLECEIARTVDGEQEVAEEIRYLYGAVMS